jgi:hypothetical protein
MNCGVLDHLLLQKFGEDHGESMPHITDFNRNNPLQTRTRIHLSPMFTIERVVILLNNHMEEEGLKPYSESQGRILFRDKMWNVHTTGPRDMFAKCNTCGELHMVRSYSPNVVALSH